MKNSEIQMELQKIVTEINQKHTYFLLAAVGACVGFAITQTRDSALSLSFLPLAIGLFFWGLSFFVGCLTVQQVIRMINVNLLMLEIKEGRVANIGSHPITIEHSIDIMKKQFGAHNSRATHLQKQQFYFFIIGVISFIVWHVLEMWRRTEEYTCLFWY